MSMATSVIKIPSDREPSLSKGLKNGDIDSLRSNGFYWMRKAETTGTQPGYDFYMLIVMFASYAGATLQIAYNMSSSTHKSRMYVNGSWSAWT